MHIIFNLCDKTPGLALIGPGTSQILFQVYTGNHIVSFIVHWELNPPHGAISYYLVYLRTNAYQSSGAPQRKFEVCRKSKFYHAED